MAGTFNYQTDFNSRQANHAPLTFGIKQITENGLVIHSKRAFELGATIALGMHFHLRESRDGELESDPSISDNFLDAEGIVVDSRPVAGTVFYEVTVVFAQLSPNQCELLLAASQTRPELESPRAFKDNWDQVPEAARVGFDRICGLN